LNDTDLVLVLGEGRGWLAVAKPPGMVVIPARDEDPADSLWRRLETERGERLWVVHRIDRDTSGLVLFARSADAHRELSRAFAGRRVEKRYVAFTNGVPSATEISGALRDDGRRVHVDPRGKPSRTSLRVDSLLADGAALVHAAPLTGRRHQIRVHLASVGAPLLVDPLYGSPGPAFDPRDGTVLCDRLTLHAAQLRFPSPDGDFEEEVAAPLPPDLVRLHRALAPSS